ncbi:ester cyclase [Streptomyces sp. NPDC057616]|uniref:ester cyclase n=1 Tax=Streptomyces sp. NPDC057616 TaxID=3346183 RepID=UPI00368386B3
MTDLESRYRAYLDALNERRLDDMVHYVQDDLKYNGQAMTRLEYQEMIAADIAATPDLFFDARNIVTNQNWVASRIVFDCTPIKEFLGFQPNGRQISFAEHVFYRFSEGRIAEVLSVIDRAAVSQQLSQG